ncbi:alpha/beta fold hydrolase [Exiguobacterium aurantiacum]|uniref:Alpha/beta hydrolase n=1 Tax=Exiguobacterium aurantiacum TaxID=33987 RepID=A0ABY5FSI5_9BACL|nr:alpha/beta hydrolase [Exiguobacterium aurantiacum]UTT44408.1 alpha/beta hydrolase [Exiguobacterium aurantiacum]
MSRYYAEVIGNGCPVIFLPAGGFTGEEGRSLAEALRDDFEVHLLDLPGFGRSEGINRIVTSKQLADWVNDYVVTHRLGPVLVMAHSLGGAVGLAFATHYPEQVERLVLLDQGHKAFPRVPLKEYGVFGLTVPLLSGLYRLFGPRLVRKIEMKVISDEGTSSVTKEQVKAFCAQTGLLERDEIRRALDAPAKLGRGGLNLLFGFYHLDVPQLVRSLQVPTLLVYGDFVGLDDKEARSTRSAISDLQRHELPITYIRMTGGHFVHWNPAFPIEQVRQFLQVEQVSGLS